MKTCKICLSLVQPDHPRFRCTNAYREVMETLLWGFEALGFDCAIRVNVIDKAATNIVFGWELLDGLFGSIDNLPPGTILYNLEQYSFCGMQQSDFLKNAANKFQIWDYNCANISRWNEVNPKFAPFYARISYAPCLKKIPPAQAEDIDILFYGSVGAKRFGTASSLANTLNHWSVVTLTNVFGTMRDELIPRARLHVNISPEHTHSNIFEVVRVSYLLANRQAVVCGSVSALDVEDDLKAVLRIVSCDELAGLCDEMLLNPTESKAYAGACSEAFCSRDIRDVIRAFFA
jgi:hypothetical protein